MKKPILVSLLAVSAALSSPADRIGDIDPVKPGEFRLRPTFVSCGVCWGEATEGLALEYRKAGSDDAWRREIKFCRFVETGDSRGSLFDLEEDTEYELRVVKVEGQGEGQGSEGGEVRGTATFRTWKSDVPIAETRVIDPRTTTDFPIKISACGRPDGWIRYTVPPGTAITNISPASTFQISAATNVILEDVVVYGGGNRQDRSAGCSILVTDSAAVRIRNCDISNFGRVGTPRFEDAGRRHVAGLPTQGYGISGDAGIRIGSRASEIVVERCYIHDPRGTANSWFYSHPAGQDAIVMASPDHSTVLRWNDLLGSENHRYDDVVGGTGNFSEKGGFNRECDVYGNYFAFANDDIIEFDGGMQNTRCFDNRGEFCFVGISLQGCMVSPAYVCRNLLSGLGDSFDKTGQLVKTGSNSGSAEGRDATMFVWENVMMGPGSGMSMREYLVEKVFDNRLYDGVGIGDPAKGAPGSVSSNNVKLGTSTDRTADPRFPVRPLPFNFDRTRFTGLRVRGNGLLPYDIAGTVDVGAAVFRYAGSKPAVFTRVFTNTCSIAASTGSVEVVDLRQDVTFLGGFSSGALPFAKTGPGTMTLEGASRSVAFPFAAGQGGKYPKHKNYGQLFALPDDGTAPAGGFGLFSVLDGELCLKRGSVSVPSTDSYTMIGGHTADGGGTEKDVVLRVLDGTFTSSSHLILGNLHGFAGVNTPNGPAKAHIVLDGGVADLAGGKTMDVGSLSDPPSGRTLCSDLAIVAKNGGYFRRGGTAGTGRPMYVRQRKGQKTALVADAGRFDASVLLVGANAADGDESASVDIAVCNDGLFTAQAITNGMSKVANPPPVTVDVRDGGVLCVNSLQNLVGGRLSLRFDRGTVRTYANKLEAAGAQRYEIIGPDIPSVTVGPGGLTVEAADKTYSGADVTAVVASPITSAADGGTVTLKVSAGNRLAFAAAPDYAGLTDIQGDGTVEMPAGMSITIDVPADAAKTVSADLVGAGVLRKTGAGTLRLTGAVMLNRLEICGGTVETAESTPQVTSLVFSDDGRLAAPAGTILSVTSAYVEGLRIPKGSLQGGSFARLSKGVSVVVAEGEVETPTAEATWTGGAGDCLMSTDGNWSRSGLDLASGTLAVKVGDAGAQMIPADGTYVHSICLSRTVDESFVIGETGKTLSVAGAVGCGVTGKEVVFRGTLQGLCGVDPGAAKGVGSLSVTGSCVVALENAVIAKPISVRALTGNAPVVLARAGTTNLVSGNFYWQTPTAKITVESGAALDFRGGVTTAWGHTRDGDGLMRVLEKPYTSAYQLVLSGSGRTVFDAEGFTFGGRDHTEGLCIKGAVQLEFARSWCLGDNRTTLGFNAGSKNSPYLEFHATTQRVGRIAFTSCGSSTRLRGDYPAMLEITGGVRPKMEAAQRALMTMMTNRVDIQGGLGLAFRGELAETQDEVFKGSNESLVLAGRAYSSCGDLLVTGGTLELAADASWPNGTNFCAWGEGTLRFTTTNQVNAGFAELHFRDNGRVYVPEGVTVVVMCAALDGERETLAPAGDYTATSAGALAGRVTGGGTLRVRDSVRRTVETREDKTSQGDWTVDVEADCTNVVTVTQTGSGKIVKTGKGALVMSTASTFAGGIELRGGELVATAANAFGTGVVTVCGQCAEYAGICQIVLRGAGAAKDRVVALPNDIHFTGNTTITYPGLYVYGHGSELSGKITADRDFVFQDDVAFCSAEWPGHLYDMSKYCTAVDFRGEVDVAGAIRHDGWCRFVFGQKVTAAALNFVPWSSKVNPNAAYEFHVPCAVGKVMNSRHDLHLFADNVFAGAEMSWNGTTVTYANVYLNGHSQTLASLDGAYADSASTDAWTFGRDDTAPVTLTLTGAGEHASSAMLRGRLSLAVDAAADFVQTLSGRSNPMTGAIAVTRGTLRIADTAAFKGVTSLRVEDTLVADGLPFADGAVTLSLGADAKLFLGEADVLRVASLTVGGKAMPKGVYLAANLPQLRRGRLCVDGSAAPGETLTFGGTGSSATVDAVRTAGKVNLVTSPGVGAFAVKASGNGSLTIGEGGLEIAADGVANAFEITAPTVAGCDQTWKIPLKKTLVLDNALKCVYGTVAVESPYTSTPADRGKLVFKGENTIDGALVVTATMVTVSGTLATPGHADQGTAKLNGAKTFTVNGGREKAACLTLTNAVIEKPLYFCYSGNYAIQAAANTTNVLRGNVVQPAPRTSLRLGAHAEVDFDGGYTSSWTFRSNCENLSGRVRVRGRPFSISNSSTGWTVDGGTLSLEAAGNAVPYIPVGTGSNAAKLSFAVDSALKTTSRAVVLAGYVYDNATEKFREVASDVDRIVDFGSTRQQVNALVGSRRSKIVGNGARVEILQQTDAPGKITPGQLHVASAIEGDVTLAMYGTGELLLTNRTFASSGALVVTNGTLTLASDAAWQGADVTVGGVGRLRAQGTLSADSRVSLADGGILEIPAGKTVLVREVRVRREGGWLAVADARSPVLAPHLAGGGALVITGASDVRRMPLEWNVRFATGIPYEVEIDTNKIRSAGTGFAVFATTASGEETLPVTTLPGRCAGRVALRFVVPAGTTALAAAAGVGSLRLDEAAETDNLFAGALASVAGWTATSSTVKSSQTAGGISFCCSGTSTGRYAEYAAAVPESWRGRSVRFELDCESQAKMVWSGYIRLSQYYDAAATELIPESVTDPRWTSHFRPPGKFVAYRDNGRLHPAAKAVKLRIELRGTEAAYDDWGKPLADPEDAKARLLVSHVALRPAEELPFPRLDEGFFVDGPSGEAGDTALVLGGERATAFFYATRGQAAWADGTQLRSESQVFFPSGDGTVEAYFRPTAWSGDPAKAVYLFEAYSGPNLSNGQKNRGEIFTVTYVPSKRTLAMMLKDMKDVVYKASAVRELALGAWTHVAASWSADGAAKLFVDGAEVASVATDGFAPLDLATASYPNEAQAVEFFLGCHFKSARDTTVAAKDGYPLFAGAVDALRVSTGARYAAAFTPATSFEVDADTRALFGFDHSYDGVSGGGDGFVLGSLRALVDRVDHRLELGGEVIEYYAATNRSDNDHAKVLDICNYPVLPQAEDFLAARRERCWKGTVTPNVPFEVAAPAGTIADFVECRNVGDEPLVYPILMREGDFDPRSFGDLRDTMPLAGKSDRDKANAIFQYVLGASDYFMIHTACFPAGSDVPGDVEYQALTMLNGYCGFECGPLNNMTANLFANVGNLPASQTAGYGHSFEQVFYDGKNHIYDLSAQKFFPSLDNETAAYLREAADQPGSYLRIGANPDHFIRKSTRSAQARTPEYREKVAFVLNPGERFKAWFDNNGEVNDLQCNKSTVEAASHRKFNYDVPCNAVRGGQGSVWRIDRFFPHYGNGFLVFDGRPSADNPAFSAVGDNSFAYQVRSCYPIVAADYAATLAGGGQADLSISTDDGTTWRALSKGHLRYPVRARNRYLIRVNAPVESVANFRASTEVQLNARILTGRIRPGANRYTLKAENAVPAEVTIGYREPGKRIRIAAGAYSGTLVGAERQLVVLEPAGSLELAVEGVGAGARARASAGLSATLSGGMLTVTAADPAMKGFGYVTLSDGGAKKELTVLVSPNVRLVTAADPGVSLTGTAELLPADSGRVQPCVNFPDAAGKATFGFAELPAGRYAVLFVDRFRCQSPSIRTAHLKVTLGSETRACGRPANDSANYYKAYYGRTGRSNFKWDYPYDPNHAYPGDMLGVFKADAAFSSVRFDGYKADPEGVELAAALVVPVDLAEGDDVFGSEAEHEFYCDLVKILCGLNTRPNAVSDAAVPERGGTMMYVR